NFPQDFDGILAGANAFNWDRFITAELWPQIVMNQEVGAPIASAKLNAVSSAAIAACDAQDGIPDGIIQDPRACTYNATAFVCKANAGPSSDPNCWTPPEADHVPRAYGPPHLPARNLPLLRRRAAGQLQGAAEVLPLLPVSE